MYNALLTKVLAVINQQVKVSTQKEERSEFYNLMFNPEAYIAYQEKKRKKEEQKQKIILGVTAAAVVGEGYHLAKRSGIVGKILKKVKKV